MSIGPYLYFSNDYIVSIVENSDIIVINYLQIQKVLCYN